MTDTSTDAALREMSRSIGGLESTVKMMVSTWQAQEASASQGRRDLHSKFDGLSEKVQGLAVKVDAAVKDISEIKPSVDAFEDARKEVRGARKLGRWVWWVVTGCAVVASWLLSNWITIEPKHWGP